MDVDEIRHFLVIYDIAAANAAVTEFDDYDEALTAYEAIEKESSGGTTSTLSCLAQIRGRPSKRRIRATSGPSTVALSGSSAIA